MDYQSLQMQLQPDYGALHAWEYYAANMNTEFRQCMEEGLDVAALEPLFSAIGQLPAGPHKTRLADVLHAMIADAPLQAGYPWQEPSDLKEIQALRQPCSFSLGEVNPTTLPDQLLGAWQGRIIGCLLGKPVEGIRTPEFYRLLQESGNWPLHRYIRSTDVTDRMLQDFSFNLRGRCFADVVRCAPVDDDTNYVVLAQVLVDRYGRDFTPENVGQVWLDFQPKNAYCTAERVAFRNLVNGYRPSDTARWQNPYREWIGAQIRGDYFGYINPGKPEAAADMAWRDACISHTKNGIYGEMFIAAAIAAAAVEKDMEKILLAGLGQIPPRSRLYAAIMDVISMRRDGRTWQACIDEIHTRFDEHSAHDWCHTISNAMIVTAALLWGEGDFSRSICLAVQPGFDTDCNGATVGSIMGIRGGTACIGPEWTQPLNNRLETSIFGVGTVKITEMASRTLDHLI